MRCVKTVSDKTVANLYSIPYRGRVNVQIQTILAAEEHVGRLVHEQILLDAHGRFGRGVQRTFPGTGRFGGLQISAQARTKQ